MISDNVWRQFVEWYPHFRNWRDTFEALEVESFASTEERKQLISMIWQHMRQNRPTSGEHTNPFLDIKWLRSVEEKPSLELDAEHNRYLLQRALFTKGDPERDHYYEAWSHVFRPQSRTEWQHWYNEYDYEEPPEDFEELHVE